MSDLKRKLRAVDIDTLPRNVRARLSPISPRQLHEVLDFFHAHEISVSSFINSFLALADSPDFSRHEHLVDDLAANVSTIMHSFLSFSRTSAPSLLWAHNTMTTVYKREIRALTEKDTGWHFTADKAQAAQFGDFSMDSSFRKAEQQAPLVWELLDHLFCSEGEESSKHLSEHELQLRKNVKKIACISSIAHANNQRCNELPVIIGIFLHTCNTPERVIDLFFHLGLSCSQHTILAALDSLSKESVKLIRDSGQTLLVGYAYDNFDMQEKSKTPTVEQSTDTLRHLTSGTLLPLQFTASSDLKFAYKLWETSRFNDMKTAKLPHRTIQDLFTLHRDSLDSHGRDNHDKFNTWKFTMDLCSHGPQYFRKFISKVPLPDFVEKVPLFKTQQVPARAMDLSNSKVDGNIATIETLLRQGGVQDIEQFKKDHPEIVEADDYVILFHGDLGTGDRIQTAQIRRSLESTPRLRLQNVIFVPGLFHIKMACADGLWRILLEPDSSRGDETSFFAWLATLRPSETSKIAKGTAGFQILNECIIHAGRVERLGWWEKIIQEMVPGCISLEDFALREPTVEEVEKLAIKVSMKYGSREHLDMAQKKGAQRRDQQYENMLKRTRYFLLYEETAHAIRSGDVGRVEICLREWIPIFKGVGKHKYASMLNQFLLDVHFVYPPELSKCIRYNWFCNISGKEMKYGGNDWLVELNNMLTKGIYGGRGANNTVDRILKESVLIQLFRDIINIIEKQFGINPKLTRHGDADMSATYDELLRRMRECGAFELREGRKSAHIIQDAFNDGIYKFATESKAESDENLLNSEELEIVATLEDIVSESA